MSDAAQNVQTAMIQSDISQQADQEKQEAQEPGNAPGAISALTPSGAGDASNAITGGAMSVPGGAANAISGHGFNTMISEAPKGPFADFIGKKITLDDRGGMMATPDEFIGGEEMGEDMGMEMGEGMISEAADGISADASDQMSIAGDFSPDFSPQPPATGISQTPSADEGISMG